MFAGVGSEVESKPTFQESFVPPEISMINYFLSKPTAGEEGVEDGVGYDSENDEDDDTTGGGDYFDEEDEDPGEVGAKEHLDPQSYSWCLLRYGIFRPSYLQVYDKIIFGLSSF